MHDIDRVLFEDESGQSAPGTYGEAAAQEGTGTYEGGMYETYGENGQFESWGGDRNETGSEEMALATELLELTSDRELDRFLGDLVSSAVSAATNFAKSDAGRAVGGLLKSAAKQVLPQIGKAVGDYISPGTGGDLGAKAGSWLGSKLELGLDVEGLSPEDRQFETARAFVRFANDAASRTARTPTSVPAPDAARRAVADSARRHLPGLLQVTAGPGSGANRRMSGRWVRRGNNIVILGA
ncbi:hypothetical protein [Prescottella agglutinans]|uniref:hypothetical protein n=1 Tax=Prescottella agglutinans TaxID=1644129 RepID=UPI003D96A0C2